MSKPVILTGLRANNDLTIGNYLGAILPMVDMAKKRAGEYQVNMFVPDLHSFTTPIDHTQLYRQVINNMKVYIAAGLPIDHDDVYVYRQSFVPAHSELTWILDCFTGFGEMSRMTQFKDKSSKLQSDVFKEVLVSEKTDTSLNRISVGLFNYPVLMAADILLYGASYIPVGEDQTQHLEFTRDIAQRINNKFGNIFKVPEPVSKQHNFFGKDQGLRIKDLQDPTKKMSKSDDSGKGVIFLSDEPTDALKKVMSATTDSFGEIRFDPIERPGISNLLQILALFTNRPQYEVNAEWEGKSSYGELKSIVGNSVMSFLENFQGRLERVDENEVIKKLLLSEIAMKEFSNVTLLRAQKAVGLRP